MVLCVYNIILYVYSVRTNARGLFVPEVYQLYSIMFLLYSRGFITPCMKRDRNNTIPTQNYNNIKISALRSSVLSQIGIYYFTYMDVL